MEGFACRVLVVDDYELWRDFACSLFQNRPGFQVIGEVSDGEEAVRKAQELQPDVILLDIGLPTVNGIDAARQIRKISSKSKILFVSQESSPDVLQEALNTGAMGYVLKTNANRELFLAVDRVVRGGTFWPTNGDGPAIANPSS